MASGVPVRPGTPLSLAQRCCLLAHALGLTVTGVARLCAMPPDTVRQHTANARLRLGVTKTSHAVLEAAKLGLLGDDVITAIVYGRQRT